MDAARLRAVIEMQNEIAVTRLDAEAVMATVVRGAAGLTGADAAVVELVEDEDMVYRAVHGLGLEHLGLRLRKATSLSGLCVTLDQALCCDDAERDPRVDAAACRRIGVRSMICVPLRHERRAVGVLKVCSGDRGHFGPGDVELLDLLSGVIAAHLAHAAEYGEAARDAALLLREREHRQQLEELDRVRQEILSLVTHELQSPLTSIQGYVEALLDGSAGTLDDEQARLLGVVGRNAERLRSLVADLLTASRADQGRLGLDLRPVQLGPLVQARAEAIRPLADAQRLDLRVECDSGLPDVEADPDRIEQVLENLLSNAVKYTPAGGRVTLAASAGDGVLRLEVSDTGIGIPAGEQDRLFERFFRASSAAQARIPGIGLGLSITKALVEGHGGTIAVTSIPGSGSRFAVELPCAGARSGAAVTPAPAAPPARRPCAHPAGAARPAAASAPHAG